MDNEEITLGSEEDTSDTSAIIDDFREMVIRQITGKSEEVKDTDSDDDEDFDDDTDFVMLYLKKILGEDEEIDPEDVEVVFRDKYLIEDLNAFLEAFVDILIKYVGIHFDSGREIVFFSDYYTVYVTFVLNLEQTIIDGFLGKLTRDSSFVQSGDMEKELIGYAVDDGFAPMSMISTLSVIDPGNAYYDQLDSYLATHILYVDWEVFNVYVRNYMTSNRLSTNIEDKVKKSIK